MAPMKGNETQEAVEKRAHDELDGGHVQNANKPKLYNIKWLTIYTKDKLKEVFTEIQSMGQIAHGYENGSAEHLIRHAYVKSPLSRH